MRPSADSERALIVRIPYTFVSDEEQPHLQENVAIFPDALISRAYVEDAALGSMYRLQPDSTVWTEENFALDLADLAQNESSEGT